jgi:hypothetical protein
MAVLLTTVMDLTFHFAALLAAERRPDRGDAVPN